MNTTIKMSDRTRKKTGGRVSNNLPIGNTFINDGSFLEMFKKRMEEEKGRKENPNNLPGSLPGSAPTKVLQTEQNKDQTVTTDKPTESDAATTSGTKPIIQGFVGKRKALMKASELREKRKKRREQLSEEQEETDKSDAWKAYMAEVKEYQAKSCSEEVHNRPLVK